MAGPETSARDRAYELAATGEYLLWPPIAAVLASEGFGTAAIKKIGKDRAAQRDITALIHAAIARNPRSAAETWRLRAPDMRVKLKF
jgi:hypothetical protein